VSSTPYPVAIGRGDVAAQSRGAGAVRATARNILVLADVIAVYAAYATSCAIFGVDGLPLASRGWGATLLFFAATAPVWIVVAAAAGLYGRDRRRTTHSTVDELAEILKVFTLGTWVIFPTAWLAGIATPQPSKLVAFWALAIVMDATARAAGRSAIGRAGLATQRVVVVGAGDVGQLVGRKLIQHPEYRLQLVGFVDARPKERRSELADVRILGNLEDLPSVIDRFHIDRVIVAFSNESHEELLAQVRAAGALDVHVDVVPRLFELVSPRVELHDVEGLPLVALSAGAVNTPSKVLKRALDVLGASMLLVLTAPIFAFAAWRIKRDSAGPVFFRQTRLGLNMREFTVLKFRTMHTDVDDLDHRAYIQTTMQASSTVGSNGMYKLERADSVTRSGRWLRRSSLDELPQLINVLRGDMSLVGPRPCIPYETEHFEPHHFERFRVPAGLTGLWQVTARARATFGESLDMDVSYVHGWSVGLDLKLLLKTPLQLFRPKGTA
jgi:exopolysaccharide biosynthesis polyprenyl glycosylphosphotransferase